MDDSIIDACLIRHEIEAVLGGRHPKFVEAPRLIDAFELLDDIAFDLILLDLNLLDMAGTATVSAMHAQTPNTPIVVYSGMNDPALIEDTILCGAADYLVKDHIPPEVLRATLQRTLLAS